MELASISCRGISVSAYKASGPGSLLLYDGGLFESEGVVLIIPYRTQQQTIVQRVPGMRMTITKRATAIPIIADTESGTEFVPVYVIIRIDDNFYYMN